MARPPKIVTKLKTGLYRFHGNPREPVRYHEGTHPIEKFDTTEMFKLGWTNFEKDEIVFLLNVIGIDTRMNLDLVQWFHVLTSKSAIWLPYGNSTKSLDTGFARQFRKIPINDKEEE